MAITIGNVTTAFNSGSVNNFSIASPADAGDGDIVVMCYSADGPYTCYPEPGSSNYNNWYLLGNEDVDVESALISNYDDVHGAIWWKVAGGSEPANYEFSMTGSGEYAAICFTVAGCSISNPIHKAASAVGTTSDADTPSVTTTEDDCAVVSVVAWDTGGSVTLTDDPGLTEIDNHTSDACGINASYEILVGTATTGAYENTLSSNEQWVGWTIAFREPKFQITDVRMRRWSQGDTTGYNYIGENDSGSSQACLILGESFGTYPSTDGKVFLTDTSSFSTGNKVEQTVIFSGAGWQDDQILFDVSLTDGGSNTIDPDGDCWVWVELSDTTTRLSRQMTGIVSDPKQEKDCQIAHGYFTSPSTTGNHDVVTGMDFTPKAVMLFAVYVTNSDTSNAAANWCYGMSDGTNDGSVWVRVGDTSANNDKAHSVTSCLRFCSNTANSTTIEATCNTFTTNKITMNFSTVSGGVQCKVHWVAFGGDDIEAYVEDSWEPDDNWNAAGYHDYDGLTFRPNVMFSIGGMDDDTGIKSNSYHCFGGAFNTEGGARNLRQWIRQWHFNGTGSSSTSSTRDHCVRWGTPFPRYSTSSIQWCPAIARFTDTGFICAGNNSTTYDDNMFTMLFLKLPNPHIKFQMDIEQKDSSGTNGVLQEFLKSTVSTTPDFAMMLATRDDVSELSTSAPDTGDFSLSIGMAMTDTDEHGIYVSADAGTATSQMESMESFFAKIGDAGGTSDATALMSNLVDSEVEVEWDVNDTQAANILTISFETDTITANAIPAMMHSYRARRV